MTLSLAYNTTDAAILADGSGYLIDGRGWGPVDTTDAVGSGELDAGRLILADEAGARASDNPAAQAAVAALDDRRRRLEEARALSKTELVEALPSEQVAAMPVGGDGMPPKDELVEAVAAQPADEDDTPTTTKPRRGARQ